MTQLFHVVYVVVAVVLLFGLYIPAPLQALLTDAARFLEVTP